ncbi:MAG: hypothetical protein K0R39_4268 [Symbiobacteriaceae bacterium]|jgi:hypothetical protein|nr:hypothetical protein [Symbiobacteriaceae bacterium]
MEIIRDYRMVRGVGLALAALAFFVALTRLGSSDMPQEHSRAQGLLIRAAVIFLLLAGDRLLARGVAEWFGFTSYLPVFWQ